MRYMLFLQNSFYQPKDSLWLKNKARELSSTSGIAIRDARVSRFHIEYDISIPDYDKIVKVAHMFRDIGDYSSSYHVIEKRREKLEAISEAKSYFNEEKYWIAHEILESIWKESTGVEKELNRRHYSNLCSLCTLPEGRRGDLHFYPWTCSQETQ